MNQPSSFPQEFLQLPQRQVQSEESQSLSRKLRFGFLLCLAFCIIGIIMVFGCYFLLEHSLTTQDPLPCRSPACMSIAEHISAAMVLFSRSCDYFLFSCKAEISPKSRGRHRDKTVSHDVTRRDKTRGRVETGDGMRMDIDSDTERKRNDRFPDRHTALLQTVKVILGSINIYSSLCYSSSSVHMDPGPCSHGHMTLSLIHHLSFFGLLLTPKKNITSAEQKAQTFYNTCMKPNTTLNESINHVQMLIQQLGGWPVFGNWTQPKLKSTLTLLMSRFNTFPFFNVYVGPDKNESRNYIQIDQPDFQFPVEWNSLTNRSKFNSQSLRPFFACCRELLSLLNVSFISSTQHCGLYMSLSSTLVINTAPLSYRHRENLLYHRVTIQELQELAPEIDWLSCLQALFHPNPVSKSDFVLLHNQHYIASMSQTISNFRTQHEHMGSYPLHTYMIINLLQTLMPSLHSKFMQTMKNFTIAINNENEVVPHWRHCVLQTVKGFDTLISHLIKEHYAGEEAEKLISDVYYSFKTKITNLSWQNEDTPDLVLNKINSLTPRLSTNKEFFNQLKPEEQFEQMIMSEKIYFSNYLQMLAFQQRMRSNMLTLSHPPQSDVLSIYPFLSGNDIIIPVGMLVLPWFHSSYPRAVNYGMLGTLIAKDLLHLLLPDILSQSRSAMQESECLWSHYLRAQKGASSLSPSQQQEVWVQYSALQVALLSYRESLQRQSNDTSVSGISYIHLFSASFMQASCDSELYTALMPFEPSFLLTVLCVSPVYCPESLTCVDNTPQGHRPGLC